MSAHERTTVEKLRRIAQNSSVSDIQGIFAKFASKGSDKISHDELLIAMSRVSDNIQLGDVKELHRIVVGAHTSHDIEDVRVSVNEVVQLLTL